MHLCVEVRLQVLFLKNCPSDFPSLNLIILEHWEGLYGWAVSPGNPSMSAHQSLGLEVCVVMPIFPASEYGLVKIPQRKRVSVCGGERPERGHQFWKQRGQFHQNHSLNLEAEFFKRFHLSRECPFLFEKDLFSFMSVVSEKQHSSHTYTSVCPGSALRKCAQANIEREPSYKLHDTHLNDLLPSHKIVREIRFNFISDKK